MHRTIDFPNLGIHLKSVGDHITVFGFDIAYYGIVIGIGILAGLMMAVMEAKRTHQNVEDYYDLAIYGVIFSIIGARAYYVIFSWDMYKDDIKSIINIREGGLAIYGGIIAGGIALIIVSKIKKIKVGSALDMIAPAVMLGQLIGRWGNFFNAEAYGEVTDLPWRMGLRDVSESAATYVHPTFLYESLWNLLGFIIINLLYKRKKFNGQVFLMYISWYGFGRMFIEGLRTDSLYVGDFRISQLVGFACFFIGSAMLIAMLIVTHLRKKEAGETAVTESAAPAEIASGAEKAEEAEKPAEISAESAPDVSEEKKDDAEESTGFDISDIHNDDGE